MQTAKKILFLLLICTFPQSSFSELTLEQKIGQLFITFFHGEILTPELKKHFPRLQDRQRSSVQVGKWFNG